MKMKIIVHNEIENEIEIPNEKRPLIVGNLLKLLILFLLSIGVAIVVVTTAHSSPYWTATMLIILVFLVNIGVTKYAWDIALVLGNLQGQVKYEGVPRSQMFFQKGERYEIIGSGIGWVVLKKFKEENIPWLDIFPNQGQIVLVNLPTETIGNNKFLKIGEHGEFLLSISPATVSE